MYAFNSAAIFSPGHPYIESTTVLSDIYNLYPQTCMSKCFNVDLCTFKHIIIVMVGITAR